MIFMEICIILAALILDYFLGEPRRFHPLVGLGWVINKTEKHFNRTQNSKIKGVIALCLIVIPVWVVVSILETALETLPLLLFVISAIALYMTIGWRSLIEHAEAVRIPLQNQDITTARQKVSYLVTRDTAMLNEEGISKAATESVLENGNDAIFAPLFWFFLAGVSGVVLYRVANTLDAMWGYKNKHFFYFGWAAAKFDDVLNWMPARLCALSYALCGSTRLALKCWQEQSKAWKSPNAGPVMASGAGALNVKLGGVAHYQGDSERRPPLGCGEAANWHTIKKAETLLNHALILWVVVLITATIII